LIQQKQNQQIVEIVVVPIVPFNIFTNVWYNWVKIANDELTLWAFNFDFKKSIKKSDVLSIQEEWNMFDQTMYQLTFPSDLNLRFGYLCMKNFFIHGYFRPCNVDFEKNSLLECPIRLVLRFCQGVSKNLHINVTRCLAN
jgi:hypothetical protein